MHLPKFYYIDKADVFCDKNIPQTHQLIVFLKKPPYFPTTVNYARKSFDGNFTNSALADEPAGDVDAGATAGADVRIGRALVDVFALVCHPDLPGPTL